MWVEISLVSQLQQLQQFLSVKYYITYVWLQHMLSSVHFNTHFSVFLCESTHTLEDS